MNPAVLAIYILAFLCTGVSQWTGWYDRDNPDGNGDFELTLQQGSVSAPCGTRVVDKIQCVVGDDSGCISIMPGCAEEQVVDSSLDRGCWCNNTLQPIIQTVQCTCCDYKVRYHCTDVITSFKPVDSNPKIVRVWPTRGPESGGTLVTVSGTGLDSYGSPQVYLATTGCNVVQVTTTDPLSKDILDMRDLKIGITSHVICRTPSVVRTGHRIGDLLPVSIHYNSKTTVLSSEYTFEYRGNPIIETVEPRKTIVSGGIVQTITGKRLDSVTNPILIIYLYYDNVPMESFEQPCRVTLPTYECPAPAIDVNLIMNYRLYGSAQPPLGAAPANGTAPNHKRKRKKRQAEITSLPGIAGQGYKLNDGANLDFNLGLKLDGYRDYEYLSAQIPEYAQIEVFVDPILEPFDEPGRIQKFRPYWPFNHKYVDIKGQHLTQGLVLADYLVNTGIEPCPVKELSINKLTMRPPIFEPDPMGEPPTKHPEVQVALGNLLFSIGYLEYEDTLWEYEYARIGIIAGAVLVGILLIILIVLCCKRRRGKDDKKQERPHRMEQNGKP